MTTNLKNKIKTDSQKAAKMQNEIGAAVSYYSRIAWQALKKPLCGLSFAMVMSSCGIIGNSTQNASDNKNDQHKTASTEQVEKIQQDYEYGYSDANEVVETDYEKDTREVEDAYWEIIEGKKTSTDKANYGKLGKGAPSRLTAEEIDEIYNAKSKVGTGLSHEDQAELEQRLHDNASGKTRDISWMKAVKDNGYRK